MKKKTNLQRKDQKESQNKINKIVLNLNLQKMILV